MEYLFFVALFLALVAVGSWLVKIGALPDDKKKDMPTEDDFEKFPWPR